MTEVDLAAARAGIDGFWEVWPELRRRLDRLIDGNDSDGIVEAVSPLVSAIHPQLAWEHAKGLSAVNALVVTSEGNRALRSTAERWLRAAPAPDAEWEFHPARQADLTPFRFSLGLDGVELPLGDVRVAFEVDRERQLVDVVVHHPLLGRLGNDKQLTFKFLVLDWLLGEDGVERWLGGIDASVEPPPGAGRPEELLAAVDELARLGVDTDWVVLEAQTEDGLPVVAAAMAHLKPIDYPLFDLHVAIELTYANRNAGLLPEAESSEAMNALEAELEERLGGHGLVVAHEAVGGVRTTHVYADAERDALELARGLAAGWGEGETGVWEAFDPAWDAVAHLRT